MLKQKIKQLKAEIETKQAELAQLLRSCEHETMIKKYDSAICDCCGTDFGWWCPDSSDHVCDYIQEDGEYDEDSCRYCGQPEERK